VNPEEHPAPAAFDEARALEELEKLRAQIVEARAARGRVEDEFEAFIRGFRTERQPEEEADAPHVVPAPPEPVSDVGAAVIEPGAREARPADAVRAGTASIGRRAPSQRRSTRATLVITLAAIVIGGAAFAVRGRRSRPTPPAPTRPTPVAVADVHPTTPVAQPQTAPAPAGVNLEMTTRRRVWVRVTIDGRRAFEREFAADQRVPLHADRTILIRAGDAGAVALTRDGRNVGLLGRDGMIATREFTVETPPR
jgi:hypothetical protein